MAAFQRPWPARACSCRPPLRRRVGCAHSSILQTFTKHLSSASLCARASSLLATPVEGKGRQRGACVGAGCSARSARGRGGGLLQALLQSSPPKDRSGRPGQRQGREGSLEPWGKQEKPRGSYLRLLCPPKRALCQPLLPTRTHCPPSSPCPKGPWLVSQDPGIIQSCPSLRSRR